MPLLPGITGGPKMSKSLGNHVGITEAPPQQFGKLMRIPDDLLPTYLRYVTGWEPEQLGPVLDDLASGVLHPNAAKRLLARTVVELYHAPGSGAGAEEQFDRVFRAHEAPSDIREVRLAPEQLGTGGVRMSRLLVLAGLVGSNREGTRKIAEGGVRLAGEVVREDREVGRAEVDGATLQMGRRAWARVRVGSARVEPQGG
jgi:tyrosyl-tRNA synthetase